MRVRARVWLLALSALLVLSIPAMAGAKLSLEPVSVTRNRLSIAVDPRIELLSIVQYLSDYGDTHRGLVTRLDHSYRKDVDEWFARSKSDPVVAMFSAMSAKGFSYDAPPHAVLYLNPDFSLNEVIFTDDGRDVSRAGGKARMIAFASALKAFAAASDFATFYSKHASLYKQIAEETFKNVEHQDIIDRIEHYYGEKRSTYTVVTSPLLGQGNYGVQTELKPGVRDIYCVMGAHAVRDGVPLFGSADFFDQLQRHEFSHSFVNLLAEKHPKLVAKYSSLFGPMKQIMEKQAYGQWGTVVNESVVRAVTTRLAHLVDGRDAGDKELHYHKDRGFVFSDALVKKLETYEQNRDTYPTLDSFYPELLASLSSFSESSVAEAMKPAGAGAVTVNDMATNARAVVHEIPEGDGRDDAIRFVGEMHDRFFGRLEIIDANKLDESALKDKLKGDFIVYTTIGSKLFNAATRPLSIPIADGTLDWNGVKAPVAELRIILVGKNPFGKGNCVVYAAGTNRLLVGINGCFHGPCSYHIFQGDKLLKEGFYDASFAATEKPR